MLSIDLPELLLWGVSIMCTFVAIIVAALHHARKTPEPHDQHGPEEMADFGGHAPA